MIKLAQMIMQLSVVNGKITKFIFSDPRNNSKYDFNATNILTDEELAARDKEYFEAGQQVEEDFEQLDFDNCKITESFVHKTVDDYEQSKLKR